jgi:Fic family protein
MRPDRFSDASPGRLVPTELGRAVRGPDGRRRIEPVPAYAFLPDPLPPELDWRAIKGELFDTLTAAVAGLERVNGLLTLAPNAAILRRALWLREARLSSEIENIHTTALDMVLAGAGRRDNDAGREAWNAVRAVEVALDSDLPFSGRLIRTMHKELMTGVRGGDKSPGEYRDGAVYIGSPDHPETPRFVPPPAGAMPGQVEDCMRRLERFTNADHPEIPAILCVAMTHYQFETIHPFRDGNGRIGRALILHQLCSRGLLEVPVVAVSGFFQQNRVEYVERLFRVSADADWLGWLRFFSQGVASASGETRRLAERLLALHKTYAERIRSGELPARLMTLLDRVFDTPVVTAKSVARLLEVTDPTARKDISTMEDIGLLVPTEEVSYGRTWYAPEILAIIEASPGQFETDA